MLFFKSKKPTKPYDKENLIPVIRTSICSGEKVAGFKEKVSGKFHEEVFIQSQKDYDEYLRFYEVDPADVKQEW